MLVLQERVVLSCYLLMLDISLCRQSGFDQEFCFESYGVKVRIRSNDAGVLRTALDEARKALAGNVAIVDNKGFEAGHSFSFELGPTGRWTFYHDGEYIATDEPGRWLLQFFNTRLRYAVVENAEARVFLHAGVVGCRGKAIILPARSMHGKTTLVSEMVRQGATYYSDEYAVLDKEGRVHPYPRMLSVRKPGEIIQELDLAPEELGGEIGSEPIEVGLVVLTEYRENAEWRPQALTTGAGILEVIPHTLPLRAKPHFTLEVLSAAMRNARIIKGPRGEARDAAGLILNFLWQ